MHYSFNLVRTPSECAACGRLVTSRLAGHCFQDPMCDPCFRLAAPDLAEEVLKLQAQCSIQQLETRRHHCCANCGDNLVGQRVATFHFADPLCTECMKPYSRELPALVLLHKAALDAGDGGRDAPGMLNNAISYSQLLLRLDAERAESLGNLIRRRRRG